MLTKEREKRHKRVRAKVFGTPLRPRLSVFRSAKHIYAQVIDDEKGITLVAASSLEKDFGISGGNIESAKKVGKILGERCLKQGIEKVVFDRGGYLYHGRVMAVADEARKSGLKF